MICGKNGDGKSTFLDVLSFCLHGKPYRNIKIAELINRKNKGKLFTECCFSVNDREYIITRCLLPNSIKITENGKEIDLLSSKKLNQEEIDKIIGIDSNLFRQVICLAVNYNKPFLSLSSMEKRDIAESIFNIKVFGNMLKIMKKNSTGLKVQSEIHKKSLDLLESHISGIRKQLANIKSATKDFEKNKKADLDEVDEKIVKYSDEISVCQTEISNLNSSLLDDEKKDFSLESLQKDLSSLEKSLSVEKFKIKQAQTDIDNLNSTDICTVCRTKLTAEHKEIEIGKLLEKIETAKSVSHDLDVEIFNLKSQIESKKKLLDTDKQARSEIGKHQEKISLLDREIFHLKNKRASIEERTLNFNVDLVNKDFETKKTEYTDLYQQYKDTQTKMKNHEIISSILSDSGIKTFFLRKMLPILNSKINMYLNKFELPIHLTFNEMMEETIRVLGSDTEVSYFSFSEGEKKRIDISILFSFIEVTKVISNWNCNLLILDEILDSATDSAGLDKMMYAIKGMTYENKDLCIYMISHRIDDNYKQLFDKIMIAKKTNGYSSLMEGDT